MLKHHAPRLARRFVTLFVLIAALTTLLSIPTSSSAWGGFCWRTIDDNGECAYVCCPMPGEGYCTSSRC